METGVAVTFIVYLVFLLAIGFYFYRRSATIEDYLLGGRGMGAWVTALSAQASDMSGWLLMGLPGALYLSGLVESWIAIGLFAGTVLNWMLVAGRLRIYTEKTDSITLPGFFQERFKSPWGLLRIVSAIIILFFFTIYASAGLVAAGRLFETIFDFDYRLSILIGGVIIVGYTFMGGFLAVCWTDLFQGLLMLAALVIVPIRACRQLGGIDAVTSAMELKNISTSLIPRDSPYPMLAIISAAAWGLGYFGQPHILARFMSAKSLVKIKESMAIAFVWVFVSLCGAVIVGLVAIGMFDGLADGEEDKVFIYMIGELFGPWTGGILLAAILSAIMSTIDSQLLVSSSALTEDFYQKIIKRDVSQKEIVLVGRVCVIVMSIVAAFLALTWEKSIMTIVKYAWAGFGAAFGPVVLFALFSRRTGWPGALAGMMVGAVVVVVWRLIGMSEHMYEIVPGFIANCATIVVVNLFAGQKDAGVFEKFRQVKTIMRGEKP